MSSLSPSNLPIGLVSSILYFYYLVHPYTPFLWLHICPIHRSFSWYNSTIPHMPSSLAVALDVSFASISKNLFSKTLLWSFLWLLLLLKHTTPYLSIILLNSFIHHPPFNIFYTIQLSHIPTCRVFHLQSLKNLWSTDFRENCTESLTNTMRGIVLFINRKSPTTWNLEPDTLHLRTLVYNKFNNII